jgi:tRNA-uridine 2-sulfurtransferase
VNWLRPPPAGPFACEVKLRAREAPQPATAEWDAAAELLRVRPAIPAIAAPGQACVLYDGECVLGGGFIRRADAALIDTAGTAA